MWHEVAKILRGLKMDLGSRCFFLMRLLTLKYSQIEVCSCLCVQLSLFLMDKQLTRDCESQEF